MKHKRSEWMSGLLFAEHMCQDGWRVCELDYVEEWFSWTYMDSNTKQTVYGVCEWLDGVRDYYKNKRQHQVEHMQKCVVKEGRSLGGVA